MDKSPSGRRESSEPSSSPEFEFWMTRNPSGPHHQLCTADKLFDNGVLLPLQSLPQSKVSEYQEPCLPGHESEPEPQPQSEPSPPSATDEAAGSAVSPSAASGRFMEIFRKMEKSSKGAGAGGRDQMDSNASKAKRQVPRKDNRKSSGAAPTDLNINIWPFSRSRSAGTGSRPKASLATARKASSAPCSRSNSRGESPKPPRKWPPSPGKAGLLLGRSGPVWRMRRGGSSVPKAASEPGQAQAQAQAPSPEKGGAPGEYISSRRNSSSGSGGGFLNLNVPLCIGYRHQTSCRREENGGSVKESGQDCGDSSADAGAHDSNHNVNGGVNLLNFRALFSKKVY